MGEQQPLRDVRLVQALVNALVETVPSRRERAAFYERAVAALRVAGPIMDSIDRLRGLDEALDMCIARLVLDRHGPQVDMTESWKGTD